MATTFQDYYETLGVSRTASQEDIQRTYRKLARKFHPDINKAPDAEEQFKKINEAYEVLGDSEKRKKYDDIGTSWKEGQTYGAPPFGEEGHYTFHTDDPGQFSDFFQSLFGGAWQRGFSEEVPGGGRRRRRGRDLEAVLDLTLKEACSGGRKTISLETAEPGPDGRPTINRKTYEVAIPPGVNEGSVIRLAGRGGPGIGGGEPGDLFLAVHLLPDPRFAPQDHDLTTTVDITPWEAALGAKVEVPTMDGAVKMSIPAGTQSGQVFRLKGKGMPRRNGARGDLLVTARMKVPSRLTDGERRLFEELARESAFNPRR